MTGCKLRGVACALHLGASTDGLHATGRSHMFLVSSVFMLHLSCQCMTVEQ